MRNWNALPPRTPAKSPVAHVANVFVGTSHVARSSRSRIPEVDSGELVGDGPRMGLTHTYEILTKTIQNRQVPRDSKDLGHGRSQKHKRTKWKHTNTV